MGARGGVVLLVLLLWSRVVVVLWDVVVLLADSWCRGWGGLLLLVVVVLLGGSWAVVVDWGRSAVSLVRWVVPSLVVGTIVELAGLVVGVDVVALGLSWLVLWLDRLGNGLWWCWRGNGQVISGGLESER